jgi:hypothetical protein
MWVSITIPLLLALAFPIASFIHGDESNNNNSDNMNRTIRSMFSRDEHCFSTVSHISKKAI